MREWEGGRQFDSSKFTRTVYSIDRPTTAKCFDRLSQARLSNRLHTISAHFSIVDNRASTFSGSYERMHVVRNERIPSVVIERIASVLNERIQFLSSRFANTHTDIHRLSWTEWTIFLKLAEELKLTTHIGLCYIYWKKAVTWPRLKCVLIGFERKLANSKSHF